MVRLACLLAKIDELPLLRYMDIGLGILEVLRFGHRRPFFIDSDDDSYIHDVDSRFNLGAPTR